MTSSAVSERSVQPAAGQSEHVGMTNVVLGFALFIALGLFVPMLILAQPDSHRSVGWIFTFCYTVIAAGRLAVLAGRGERRLFEFIFWLFVYVFFGLAPTVQMRQNLIPGTTQELDPFLDLPTVLLAGGGIAATAIGFAWAYRHRAAPATRSRRARTPLLDRWSIDISVGRLVLLTLVGLAAAGYYVAKVGPGTLLGSRTGTLLIEDQLWPDPSVAGIVRATSSFPILVAAHGWWSLARSSERKGLWVTAATVLTAISLVVTNPISSSRYASGVVWGSFLGPLGAYRSRIKTSVTLVSLIGALLFLFPLADLFRRVNTVNVHRAGFLAEYGGNGDYDAFGQLSNAILYDQTMPFEFGRQFLGQVLFWLPRSVWADKPVNTGTLLAEFRGYDYTNLSAPIWAELLLNFGLVGVIVLSVGIGIGLGRLDRAFRDLPDLGVLPIATAVLPFYLLILLRGSLLQATGSLVVMVGAMVFISLPRRRALDALPPPTGRGSPSSEVPPSAPAATSQEVAPPTAPVVRNFPVTPAGPS